MRCKKWTWDPLIWLVICYTQSTDNEIMIMNGHVTWMIGEPGSRGRRASAHSWWIKHQHSTAARSDSAVFINKRTNERTKERTNERTQQLTNQRMNEWTIQRKNRRTLARERTKERTLLRRKRRTNLDLTEPVALRVHLFYVGTL